MSRKVTEWIGKTDDASVPPRVRLRIFNRCGGICHISHRVIRAGEAWELDHILALVNGGSHRESNLAPVLKCAHKEKTKEDVALKVKNNRKRMSFLGIKKRGRPIPGSKASGLKKGFDGIVRKRQ
jgi:5-methylcytosine-specific restriction endonuclease McrA